MNYHGGRHYPTDPQSLQLQQVHKAYPEAIISLKSKYFTKIKQLIDDTEHLLYAGMIEKINEDGVEQERIIIITTQHVYNVDPNDGFFAKMSMCSSSGLTVKRKIKVAKIVAVTASVNQTSVKQQFVIHVRGDYDYRFNGGFSREKVLKSLLYAHFCHTPEPLYLYCKEDADLREFQTTQSESNKKKTRQPREVPIFVTPELAKKGIEWILANRFEILANNTRPVIVPVRQIQPVQQVQPIQPVRPTGPSGPNGAGFPQPIYPNNRNIYQPPTFPNNNGIQNGGYAKPQFYVPEMVQPQANFQALAQQQGQETKQLYPQLGFPQPRISETNDLCEKLLSNNGSSNYNVQIDTFAPPKYPK